MPDNIYPDLSNDKFDVKYHQLRVLGSDIRRAINPGRYSTGSAATPPTEGGGGPNSESGSGSGTGTPEQHLCRRWVNVGRESATGVSYIDCDGLTVLGASIDPYGFICALEITNFGVCGALVETGPCIECAPCCAPTINSVTVN